jgi:glucose-6-phosphate isomerase
VKKNISFKNNIQKNYLNQILIKNLTKDYKKIIKEIDLDINNSRKTLNILNDKFECNFKIKDLRKFRKYNSIAFIGMGGSILGIEAITNFLEEKIKKKIYFFDNLEPRKISIFKKKKNFKKILFLIISKSGNTIETLSNVFALNIIKKNSKNVIVITEQKDNIMLSIVKKFGIFYIEHKDYIGGRYSILSEVGLIPVYLIGLNIFKFRSKIKNFLKGKERNFLKESAIKLASLLKAKKIKNLIFINYAPELEKFLFWCQQLVAESLGKKGKGFLPTISNAPKDHHSLLQLYLDGPRDKLFHIFSVNEKSKETINTKKILRKNNFLNKKNLSVIKTAQKNALIEIFKKNKIPFREFKINSLDEQVLGKLFSYYILETVLIGKLAKINPFDQPSVEQVKTYTKKLLT